MKYFETNYLGKPSVKAALRGNAKLQKMLSVKALKSSTDSKSLTTSDFKRLSNGTKTTSKQLTVDIDNYINPFGF
jgi:hypothetical protein